MSREIARGLEPRSIKFKFWDTNKKSFDNSNECVIDENGKVYRFVCFGYDQYMEELPHIIPLQYTELKDRNGAEIYEGDVVEDSFDGHIGLVEWSNDDCAFVFKFHKTPFMRCDLTTSIIVIGNIYENPSLLEN